MKVKKFQNMKFGTVLGRYNESTKSSVSESYRIVRLMIIVRPTP
jgi:hypothetical protein